MRILYSGFDSIYFAVQGALNPVAEQGLARAKGKAVEKQEHVAFTCHKGQSKFMLLPNGKKGGYAYVIDTGHLGSVLSVKKNLGRTEWNGFVEIKSASLLAYGWEEAVLIALKQLEMIGFHKVSISLNRVDFCIDFMNPNLVLDASRFITHSRVKKTSYYEPVMHEAHVHKSSVTQSDHVQSVTLGKMPGRQIIVYDKRAEVIASRKTYWFSAWGIDRHDPTHKIYRVEIRAGKNELKSWNIVSIDDFKRSIGLTILTAAKAVRYVIPNPNDSHVSRAPLHPLWKAVQNRLGTALSGFNSPIEPPILLDHMRQAKALEYQSQIIGNIGGYLGCKGVKVEHVENELQHVIGSMLAGAESDSQHPLWKSYNRVNEKWGGTE